MLLDARRADEYRTAPMRAPAPAYGDVFVLRVTIEEISPPIWRAIRVPADAPLSVLHEALQIAVGWKNQHLHDFRIGHVRFGIPEMNEDAYYVDERAAPLGAVLRLGDEAVYSCDFGDGWKHRVAVERVDARGDPMLRCLDGARACPPEDCGGPFGYAHLLEVLANPGHEQHAELKRCVPRGFDPAKFEAEPVNRKLAVVSKRLLGPRHRPAMRRA